LYKSDTPRVPFITKFHMAMTTYGYGIHLLFFFGMLFLMWGGRSKPSDVLFAISSLHRPELLGCVVLFGFYMICLFLLNLPIAIRVGIGLRQYSRSVLMSQFLGFYSLIPMIIGMIEGLFRKKPVFTVTPKVSDPKSHWFRDVRHIGYLCSLVVAVGIGLAHNPAAFLFNWWWIGPLLLSPFVLSILAQKEHRLSQGVL